MQAYLEKFIASPILPILLFAALGAIALGAVLRIACHSLRELPKSAAACFAILFIYIVAIAAGGPDVHGNVILNSLPFIGDLSDYSGVYVQLKTNFAAFFLEVVKLFLLAFSVNILQDLILFGKGKNVIIWYACQCFVMALAMAANYGVDLLMRRYLPEGFAEWLPAVLFILVGTILLLTLLKAIFKTVKFFSNSVLTTILSFFSQNWLGRHITQAFLSTLALALVVVLTDWMGLGFQIAQLSIVTEAFVPVVILLAVLWYLVWLLLC